MIVKCILYIIYSVAIYPRYFRRESVIRPRIEYSFEGFGVLTKFNRFLNDYASIKLTSFLSVRRFYPLHVIFHWNKREREKEGGRRPESVATSVSSPADGERNLSVEKRGGEGFERIGLTTRPRATSKLLFLPPICARKLRVLFMSYRVFTVSAIYGRSSFSSYYRWHPRPARPPLSTSGVRRSIQFCRK